MTIEEIKIANATYRRRGSSVFDKDGNIYLIYSRKEAQKMLKLFDKTTTKAFKNLNCT